jgi:chromosome segregation ATPase
MTGSSPEIAAIETKIQANQRIINDGKRNLAPKKSNLVGIDQEIRKNQNLEEEIKSKLLQMENEKKDLERKQAEAKRAKENSENKKSDLEKEINEIEADIKKAEQENERFKQEMQRLSK